ncbi:alpha/beta hydrolase family esterase [Kibdelosporangium aridum]|uniref:alpha/beta hydrolase family esterase n=1 Tax=Kibdelosporangium aridum TaxID=2030 RepID=UPI0035E5FC41
MQSYTGLDTLPAITVYPQGTETGDDQLGWQGAPYSNPAIAGAFYQLGDDQCQPQRAVPVLDLHGTADTTIPYNGVASRNLPPIPTWLGQWAQRDGCTAGPDTFFTKDDVTGQRWSGCADGSVVEHYQVSGGGHTWPGAVRTSGPGKTTRTINATQLIWDFFAAHPSP